jgi:hypothetical protein
MGNTNTTIETKTDPCGAVLEAYIKCMEEHDGVRPDPYEPEYCHFEREVYLECRKSLSKPTVEGKDGE